MYTFYMYVLIYEKWGYFLCKFLYNQSALNIKKVRTDILSTCRSQILLMYKQTFLPIFAVQRRRPNGINFAPLLTSYSTSLNQGFSFPLLLSSSSFYDVTGIKSDTKVMQFCLRLIIAALLLGVIVQKFLKRGGGGSWCSTLQKSNYLLTLNM